MKKKGFTLVEIIVSLAILGIMSVSFLTLFSSHFTWIVDTQQDITQVAFDYQTDIENRMKSLEKILLADNTPSSDVYDSSFDLVLFESDFPRSTFTIREELKVYRLDSNDKGTQGFTVLLGEERFAPLPSPTIEITELNLIRNGVESNDSNDFKEYTSYGNLGLKSIVQLTNNLGNSFYRIKHEWFVSNPGFLIPIPRDDSLIDMESDLGRIYPRFPRDYSPVPINGTSIDQAMSNLLVNDNFSSFFGRHIVYRGTPYSKDLKKGSEVVSNSIYVNGPSYLSNLTWHLDASLLEEFDPDIFDVTGNYFFMKKWNNLSPSFIAPSSQNGVPVNNRSPILASFPNPDNEFYLGPEIPFQGEDLSNGKVWGRALKNYDNSSRAKMYFDNFSTTDSGFTLYFVMRMVDSPLVPDPSEFIFKGISNDGKGWELGWTSDLKLQWQSEFSPEEESDIESISADIQMNNWYIVEIKVSESSDDDELDDVRLRMHNLNDPNNANILISGNYYSINTNELEVIWNGMELAEVMLYNQDLDVNSDVIFNYLYRKYHGI